MLKRTVPLLVLAALAVPASAAAQKIDVKGPLALRGHAFVRGELQARSETKPVQIRLQAGFVRIVDLGSDLRVRCQGRGQRKATKNESGQTVYLCSGRALRIGVRGTHYRIFGFAMQYGFLIPEGVAGSLAGAFRQCAAGTDAKACSKQKSSPTADESNQQPADQGNQRPADQSSDDDAEVASDLAQLDALETDD